MPSRFWVVSRFESDSYMKPNKASAGNGAVEPRFQDSHFRRAVPEMRRSAEGMKDDSRTK